MQLPKQWNHWLQSSGFKKHTRHQHGPLKFFKKNGRNWRVTDAGELVVSYKGDYYGATVAAVTKGIPSNRSQFQEVVKLMTQKVEKAKTLDI